MTPRPKHRRDGFLLGEGWERERRVAQDAEIRMRDACRNRVLYNVSLLLGADENVVEEKCVGFSRVERDFHLTLRNQVAVCALLRNERDLTKRSPLRENEVAGLCTVRCKRIGFLWCHIDELAIDPSPVAHVRASNNRNSGRHVIAGNQVGTERPTYERISAWSRNVTDRAFG